MALVVKNTFFHLDKHPEPEVVHMRVSRSSSEPPSFRSDVHGPRRASCIAGPSQVCDKTCSSCEWHDACSHCASDEAEIWEGSEISDDATDLGRFEFDSDSCSQCGSDVTDFAWADMDINSCKVPQYSCGYDTDTGSDADTKSSWQGITTASQAETMASLEFPGKLCWSPKTKEELATSGLQTDESGLANEATQQKLELMSQTLMGLWSTLSAVEANIDQKQVTSLETPTASLSTSLPLTQSPGDFAPAPTAQKPQMVKQPLRLAPFLGLEKPVSKTPLKRPTKVAGRLDSKARLFTPHAGFQGEIQGVLDHAISVLNTTVGVAATQIMPGAAKAMVTLSVKLSPTTTWDLLCTSVAAIAKSALLEASSNSTQVYVLGYENTPFEDSTNGSGFCAALAILPNTWKCGACWETYQQGFCPRSTTCRWQHPGRDEIQPIRVVFL